MLGLRALAARPPKQRNGMTQQTTLDPPRTETARAAPPPLVIEATRGDMVESRHSVSFAVSDPTGRILLHGGDIEAPIYARSAIKPLQALALVESGAAEAFELGDAEIALACASHNAEPRHVETVLAWLARIGCSAADLECGPQMPSRETDQIVLIRSGDKAGREHNNCSGKHSGFLSVARHLGHPTRGYSRYDHPVQQRVLGLLETMTGLDLSGAPRGIDGCGIPVIGVPLGNLALAMARLAEPDDQPEPRQAACARIRRAMAAEPFLVAGSHRFCTEVMAATAGRALVKGGAEGVYCGSVPQQGLGIAVKAADGAGRAASAAMGALLTRLEAITGPEAERLAATLTPPIRNRAGLVVGRVRPAAAPPL